MAPSGIQLPDIRVNRTFMRGIFWLLLFLFLATILTSARGIYDRINRRAELRYQVETTNAGILSDDEIWIEQIVQLRNGGNGDAQAVYLAVLLPGQNLTRWRVLGYEPYLIETIDNSRDSLALSMDRLASGAEISLIIWSSYPVYEKSVPVIVSAAFDGGIAESSEHLTSFEEFRTVGDILSRGIKQNKDRLGQQFDTLVTNQVITEQLTLLGVQDFDFNSFNDKQFKDAFVAAAVIVFAAWLFLSRELAGAVTAIVAGMLVWLYTDASVRIEWLSWGAVVIAAFTILQLFWSLLSKDISMRQTSILLFSTAVAYLILRHAGVTAICAIQANNACGDTRIAAGIVLTIWMLIADYLIRIFWRGPGKTVLILR